VFNKNTVKSSCHRTFALDPVLKMIAPDGQHEVTTLLQLYALTAFTLMPDSWL